MKQDYVKALKGELKSPKGEHEEWELKILAVWYEDGEFEKFPILLVKIYWISDTGQNILLGVVDLSNNGFIQQVKIPSDSYILVTTFDGAFISVFQVDSKKRIYYLTYDMFCIPNDIGPIPQPNKDVPIPQDSIPVIVGAGYIKKTNSLFLRKQFWQKMSDSYTLAPGENRTVGVTLSSGISEASSSIDTVSKSISASSSAGWGAISASISASMNTAHTSMNSYTVTEQKTSYETNTLVNNASVPVMLIRWQICDIVLISEGEGKDVASIISYVDPCLVQHYNLNELPEKEQVGELSSLAQSMIREYPSTKSRTEVQKKNLKK